MATTETAKNALSPAKQKEMRVAKVVHSMNTMLKQALPNFMTPERMIRVCLTQFRLNPKLMSCNEGSIVGAIIQSAQLGLEPIMGYSYLIPYGSECQFQLGYKGLIQLFYRSENALSLEARVVYQNDKFEYSYGLNSTLIHIPATKNAGPAIGYYAVAKLKNGVCSFEYRTIEQIKEHAKRYSKAKTGPWIDNFDEMGKKTLIKMTLKYMPLSVEMQKALDSDESVKTIDHNTEDIFEVPTADLDSIKTEDDPVETKKKKETIEPAKVVQEEPAENDEPPFDTETGEILMTEFEKEMARAELTADDIVGYFKDAKNKDVTFEQVNTAVEFEEFRKAVLTDKITMVKLLNYKKAFSGHKK